METPEAVEADIGSVSSHRTDSVATSTIQKCPERGHTLAGWLILSWHLLQFLSLFPSAPSKAHSPLPFTAPLVLFSGVSLPEGLFRETCRFLLYHNVRLGLKQK